jgi:3-hydroxybutyryl-CoA dehydrogenase
MDTLIIRKVGKIGVGVMGSNVAWACVVNGLETYLFDQSQEQLKRALEKIKGWLFSGKLSGEQAEAAWNRLHPCASLQETLSGVDLAFESVYEDLEVKKRAHAEIGRLAPPHVLIGSNASSLLCTPLAEASGRPEKFFNMNFTDPHSEQLVELMWNPKTSEATRRAALGWARTLKMVPIVCRREIMGYSFNRVWRAIKKEVLYVADLGACDPEDIDRAWMLSYGTSIGPFGMMDQIGLDTIQKIERRYYEASRDERDKPPKILNDLVAAGHLGEKTGRGFYTYPNPAYKQPGWLRKEPPWASPEES